MANKQTRALRKFNTSMKVVKGASSDVGKLNGGLATAVEFEATKGREVNSSFMIGDRKNPRNKRKSPWRGCQPVTRFDASQN